MARAENTEKNVFTFRWKVENFFHFEEIASPIFFAHSIDCGFALELFCSPYQYKESRISVYLKLVHGCDDFIELDFELSCLALDGSALISERKPKTRFREGNRRGFPDFMPLRDVITSRRNEFLPHETLTLQCKIWKSDGDMSESALCFARTRVRIEQSSFVWPIDGFSSLLSDGIFPYSVRKASEGDPTLSMDLRCECISSTNYRLELELMPPEIVHKITSDQDTSGKIGFYDLKLFFINASGEETLYKEKTSMKYNKMQCLQVFITKEFMDEKNGYIVNDVLSSKFQFTFYEGIASQEIEGTVYGNGEISDFPDCYRPPVLNHRHDGTRTSISWRQNIHGRLYETRMFYDVKLLSGTECIPAHKSILSSRSQVFQYMLKGLEEPIAEVSDVTVEALHQMILFIYTDTVDDMQLEKTYQLYVAAEKYNILSLKMKCAIMLAENLNENNACEMLCFAEKHKDEDLKLAVQDFIVEQQELTGSTAWKMLENGMQRI